MRSRSPGRSSFQSEQAAFPRSVALCRPFLAAAGAVPSRTPRQHLATWSREVGRQSHLVHPDPWPPARSVLPSKCRRPPRVHDDPGEPRPATVLPITTGSVPRPRTPIPVPLPARSLPSTLVLPHRARRCRCGCRGRGCAAPGAAQVASRIPSSLLRSTVQSSTRDEGAAAPSRIPVPALPDTVEPAIDQHGPVDGGDATVEVVDEFESVISRTAWAPPAIAGQRLPAIRLATTLAAPPLANRDAVLGRFHRDGAPEEQHRARGSPDPDRGADDRAGCGSPGRCRPHSRPASPSLPALAEQIVALRARADGQPQRLAADWLEHDGRVAVALDADGPVDDHRACGRCRAGRGSGHRPRTRTTT